MDENPWMTWANSAKICEKMEAKQRIFSIVRKTLGILVHDLADFDDKSKASMKIY